MHVTVNVHDMFVPSLTEMPIFAYELLPSQLALPMLSVVQVGVSCTRITKSRSMPA